MPEADINETAADVVEPDTTDAAEPHTEEEPAKEPAKRVITLTPEEFAELEMLVITERKGEDVTFAAFRHLCPTGEENSFDQKVCELYRALAEKRMIDGAEVGTGFFFFNITDQGRKAVPEPDAATKALERAKGFAGKLGSLGEKFAVDTRTVAVSLGGAAIVGLITGIIGALIGNAIA